MDYYIYYYSEEILVYNGDNLILRAEKKQKFWGRSFYKFYFNEMFILECSWSRPFINNIAKIENANNNDRVKYEKRGNKYLLKYKDDIFSIKLRSIFDIFKKIPFYTLFKNNIKTGEVFLLKKFYLGRGYGLLYKLKIPINDDSTIFQMISFIIEDEQIRRRI